MKNRSASHATFTIERTYPASPARVFKAFADPAAKMEWFAGPAEWKQDERTHDFRVGGREHLSGGPKGGPKHSFDAIYQDIIDGERIIYTYDMHANDDRISVSLATITFEPESGGKSTRMTFTEQGVFLDGYDLAESRERGTRDLLDKLETFLGKA